MDEHKDRPLSTSDIAGASREPDVRDENVAVEKRAAGAAVAQKKAANASGAPDEASAAPLFAADEAQGYRTRWDAVQTGFVDEPRRAVEEADALVADVMKHLAEGFSKERTSLERQWDRGDKISTEDLRVALRRYRSFFQRLLSV